MTAKIPVAILAATGAVGQRFIQLLDRHPWFEVVCLTGSDRRVGQAYADTVRWILPEPMPGWAGALKIEPSLPRREPLPLVFSALPAKYAREIEARHAAAGAAVCTNASAFRRDPLVPLLLPEVNADHLALIPRQRETYGWRGLIAANPNCTSTGMTVALKILDEAFGVQRVFAVSMQAVSGAGYPGVASLDMLDNVVPFIGGEEEKVEWEPRKMLGMVSAAGLALHPIQISAHTNRVPVSDGHTVCLSIEFAAKPAPAEVESALRGYVPPGKARGLPSSPAPPVVVRPEEDRPQPRLDRLTGRGMSTTVGRIRADPLFDIKLAVLSHNTIRGAAGGSIYNAELLVREGLAG
jgi:aspartate-semialdehyde dehydrogenase